MSDEPLLSISTLHEKPTEHITINDEVYHFANYNVWGAMERSIVNECWSTVTDLSQKTTRLTKAEAKRLETALDEMLDMILPGWPKDAGILTDDKEAIAGTFLAHYNRRSTNRVRAMLRNITKVTGEKPSPVSSDSTAATRKAG